MRRAQALALAFLAASACSRNSEGTVVEFWAMGREGEVVEGMVAGFAAREPGVRVRVQQVPWSAAHEKLLTAYVGGAMPDVVQLGNTWLPEFVALGALEPLDERMAGATAARAEHYFPGILDTNVLDGRTWGVPWYVDTRVLFYRTDLLRAAGFATAPAGWDGWLDALARVKAQAGPQGYAILLPMTEWQMPAILALQRGAALLRDGDRYGNFASPPVREAFAFYLDLFRRDLAPRAGEAQIANVYQDFASGYFAVYPSGPWNIGEFTRRLPADMTERWTTAPMPGADPARPGVSLAGGASLAVLRASPRKDAAWRWVEYLAEPAQQAALYRATGDLPARVGAWDDPALAANVHVRAFRLQLDHLRSTPKIPEWERIAAKIGEHADAAIRGRVTLEQALAALDADTDAILAKRRWLLERGAAQTVDAGPERGDPAAGRAGAGG